MSHYVYRCYDADRRLLYIGCTQDVEARMAVHRCDVDNPASRDLIPRLALVEVEEFRDRVTAEAAERAAIETEAPLLNIIFNDGRRAVDLPPIRRTQVTAEQRAQFAATLARFGAP